VKSLAVVFGFAFGLTACSGAPQKVGAQPSWREPNRSEPIAGVFEPTSPAVEFYNLPRAAFSPDSLGQAAVAMVNQAATGGGLLVPAADPRLFAACRELAAIMPENGVIAYNAVEFVLQRQGIIEPSPHLLVVWGNVDDTPAMMKELAPQVPEILAAGSSSRLGIGIAKRKPDGTGVMVFALQASNLSTNALARVLPQGGIVQIDASIAAGFRDPEVLVTGVDGTTKRMPLLGDASKFSSTVECGNSQGKLQIEITASDRNGSTVLANFPVWCREQPSASLVLEPQGEDIAPASTQDAEQRLLALVNRDRSKAKLGLLQWDNRIADVSRAHSQDMKQTKVVAHVSATTGSAADRMNAAKYKTALVMENVARAYGVREAHDALMNSPGHRANLMSPQATHVGIGVVFGDDSAGRQALFVTQVFVRIPPQIDTVTGVKTVFEALRTVRAVRHDSVLDKAAQGVAFQLAAGQPADKVWPQAKRELDRTAVKYARMGSVVSVISDINAIDAAGLVADSKATEVGIGVAQGTHKELGQGAIWLVLLLAEPR
jgi:uncharacterized protein YkwD